jgi:hypothetical protein
VGPDACVAVGLELRPDGPPGRTGVVAARLEVAEQVLDMMAVLVGDDVGPRERRVFRPEPLLELREEAEIELDLLVDRAVERSGR